MTLDIYGDIVMAVQLAVNLMVVASILPPSATLWRLIADSLKRLAKEILVHLVWKNGIVLTNTAFHHKKLRILHLLKKSTVNRSTQCSQ